MQWIGQGEYVSTTSHDLPVFLAMPCFELSDVVCFSILWDHLEEVHNFSEGRGCSFHGRRFGLSGSDDVRSEGHDRPGAMDGSCAGTKGRPGAA